MKTSTRRKTPTTVEPVENKPLKSFKGVKGKKFKVINHVGGHNYPTNKVLTFKHEVSATTMADCAEEMSHGNTLTANQCVLVYLTLKDLLEARDTLSANYEQEINEINYKIEFCEKYGFNEYDERQHRILIALDTLDSDASNAEKAKVIAALMK